VYDYPPVGWENFHRRGTGHALKCAGDLPLAEAGKTARFAWFHDAGFLLLRTVCVIFGLTRAFHFLLPYFGAVGK
jgi:hypothetical protein